MSNAKLAVLLAAAGVALGADKITPLASKHYAYPSAVPYQADPDMGERGAQFGYNMCNSTTEGENSLCQTSFLNSVDDFCLWAPSKPNSLIANTEGEEVAWCTKPGRGTRVIPAGALQGVQFMRTPSYVQVVGFIDQSKINIQSGDSGGELDPHGADLRGNPLGGLVYSNAFGGDNNTYGQVIEWHNFMGGDAFCFKACDPAGPHAADFCQHIYDRIGCAYNAPSAAKKGTFEVCQGDDQDYPGVYTENGKTMTYTQPPEDQGAINSMPYQPRVPKSSNCVQFSSAALFTGTAGASSGANATATASGSGSGAKTGSAGIAAETGKANGAPSLKPVQIGVPTLTATALAGVVFAVMLLH